MAKSIFKIISDKAFDLLVDFAEDKQLKPSTIEVFTDYIISKSLYSYIIRGTDEFGTIHVFNLDDTFL